MDERPQFVRDALRDRFTMSELGARYKVSRRIGYKWLARYDAEGRRGLSDRSRPATLSPPHRHDDGRAPRGGTRATSLLGRTDAAQGTPDPASARIALARRQHVPVTIVALPPVERLGS
jgi:hypothetical protein